MKNRDQRTALYRLYDADEQLLYIGVTSKPQPRWNNHKCTQPWWPDVTTKVLEWFDDRDQALDAEAAAIKAELPKYNEVHHPEKWEAVAERRRETHRQRREAMYRRGSATHPTERGLSGGPEAVAAAMPPLSDEAVEEIARIFVAIEQRRQQAQTTP